MAVSTWRLKTQSGQGRAYKELKEQIQREQGRERKLGWASLAAPLGTMALAALTGPMFAAAMPALAAGGAYSGLGTIAGIGLKGLTTAALDKNLKAFARHNIRGVGGRPGAIGTTGAYGIGASKRARESLSSAIAEEDEMRLTKAMTSSIMAGLLDPATGVLKEGLSKGLGGIGESISGFFGGGKEVASKLPVAFPKGLAEAKTAMLDPKTKQLQSLYQSQFGTPLKDTSFLDTSSFPQAPEMTAFGSQAAGIKGIGEGGSTLYSPMGLEGGEWDIIGDTLSKPQGIGSGGYTFNRPQGISMAKALGLRPSSEGSISENLLKLRRSYE